VRYSLDNTGDTRRPNCPLSDALIIRSIFGISAAHWQLTLCMQNGGVVVVKSVMLPNSRISTAEREYSDLSESCYNNFAGSLPGFVHNIRV
jgi:hypothetical protein